MDFADRIEELSAQVSEQAGNIQTEEATKNAMIMPFIAALGYNVFNPREVTPELHADVGIKKGEKVDYAILVEGKPAILFECKWHGADLSKEHASQLYRYFSVTEARFGVLTNGIQYWFYSDLDAPNKMDARPFFAFDITDYRDHDIEELKKFSKASFSVDEILTTASELKYTNAIRKVIEEEFASPSDEFVRLFAGRVYQGRITGAIREQLAVSTKKALRQFITERINQRLQSAMSAEAPPVAEPLVVADAPAVAAPVDEVVTTSEEIEAFYTVRAILYPDVLPKRVVMRDVRSYCGILLDDNNRKPICRLYFNAPKKWLGVFDGEGRTEERVPVEEVAEIHKYADRLRATLRHYEPKSDGPEASSAG